MGPVPEESSLREAIRTTLVQLCKVGVSYQAELSIEGTVGVTVDRQQVILVHFKEKVENGRGPEVQQQTVVQQQQQAVATVPVAESRNATISVTSTPLQNNVPHPSQVPLMNSPARVARQVLRDPMMSYNISPRGSVTRNIRFDAGPNAQNLNQIGGPPSVASSILSNDPGFPDSLLNDSLLMSRLYPSELDGDVSKMSQQNNTISIDIDSDESLGEDTFEFIDRLGELKTMKKEKVIKKMKKRSNKKETKSVIVIDDQSSEGPDSVHSFHARPGPSPLTATPSTLNTHHNHVPLNMDDFSSDDLLPLQDPQSMPVYTTASAVSVASGIADIKMSIANMSAHGNSSVKGDMGGNAVTESTASSSVVGHIIKTSAADTVYDEEVEEEEIVEQPTSRSKSMMNLSCEICGKIQKSAGVLEVHLVDSHGVTQSPALGRISHVTCDKCHKKFKHQASLDKHRIIHITNRPHKCQQCDRAYRHKESLSIHTMVHAGKLECRLCQKLYTAKSNFEKHISYMHETRRPIKNVVKTVLAASPQP